jgi:hypothetical protein
MELFRPHILWNGPLRWYQRAALAAWWLGQIICLSSLVVAVWVLVKANFDHTVQPGVAALLLMGFTAMVLGRALVAFTTRKKRRRRLHY